MSAPAHRAVPAALLAAALVGVFTLTRVALLLNPATGAVGAAQAGAAFLIGFAFDFVAALFICAPFFALVMLAPNRLARTRSWQALALLLAGAAVYGFMVVAVAEWLFWDEFGARFNFIAVDYLLYTHEVWGNVRESYPVTGILLALTVPAVALVLLARRRFCAGAGAAMPALHRLAWVAGCAILVVALARYADSDYREFSARDDANELAGNGVFQFFAANRRNELPFDRHYAAIDPQRALDLVRKGIETSADPAAAIFGDGVERHVGTDGGPDRPPNIVLVSIESMGAEFFAGYGNTKSLTPRLDRIAAESLWFSNVYATGNRTVRGLEALSLALPPTPGQSIVRRPGNEGLFSLGSVLEDKGYDVYYAYGGYGYFDNMNAFFDSNDYHIIDRRDIPSEKIHFATIWGVADEILFDHMLGVLDRQHAKNGAGKPFFAHIMTVSNHRPYTYPSGRIDIPSGTGRDGAVKYSDYAVGRFLDAARGHPWFDNTIFVITADHGAGGRGTLEIPIAQYRIPVFFYAPGRIAHAKIDRLASQVDIAPTLLGFTGLQYYSKFFGRDLMRAPAGSDRAFVANYQTLGYLRDGKLVTLQPGKRSRVAALGPDGSLSPLEDAALIEEAAAYYQTASLLFRSGRYRDEEQLAPDERGAQARSALTRHPVPD